MGAYQSLDELVYQQVNCGNVEGIKALVVEGAGLEEARDSRFYGPLPMTNIVGRVIYCLSSAVDHGPVQNSHFAMSQDSSVLAVELDVDEMAKSTKT
ncbi:hypothetical protein J5N97_028864 [Dioscorea zingiberensis]|uniref:Uncharacterized protein n=1 Tax=Dioscorea zingiberensis TaxID=325984 RepID=A0A9D5BZA3_9LILI|nr:hypothetical protein J5N97_028861 [Dioscorea zingiberensis]KAJ0963742.1 hypothetical protein J5N97_028864 [Dioscorea zingiberensis]